MKPNAYPLLEPPTRSQRIASTLAVLVSFVGLLIMLGWWFQITPLVELRSGLYPVKVNSGLCYLLLGIALACRLSHHDLIARIAAVPALIGGLTLLQYTLGADLGIDQLLAPDYLAVPSTPFPGRMTPLSALSFLVAGIVLYPRRGRATTRRALSFGIVGSLYAAIGSAGMLSHLLSLPGGFGWITGGTLSPYAGALALAFGCALLAAAWHLHNSTTDAPPGWLPLPVVVASTVITFILYSGLHERERSFSQETTRTTLNTLASAINLEIERQSSLLERISRSWSLIEGASPKVREADADALFTNGGKSDTPGAPAAQSLSWLDADGRTLWFYPLENNEGLARFNHNTVEVRAEALRRARKSTLPAVSGTLKIPGIGPGLSIYAPIVTQGGVSGYVVADYPYDRFFDQLDRTLTFRDTHDYTIQIGGVTVFDTRNELSRGEPIPEALELTRPIFERNVRIAISAASAEEALTRRRLPDLALITGLGITLLLGLSVHLARVARAGQRLTERANTQLRGEVEERRQAEAALRASQLAERKLGLVAARTDNIVIIARPDGAIDWVNDAFTRVLGRSVAEVSGRPAVELLAAADPSASVRLHSALDAGDPLATDVSCRSLTGRHYDLSVDLQPVYAADGRLENFILLATDITQRVETERELRRAKIEADAASRAKSDFLASMSHEIRTPMNGVIGMTSLLLHSSLTADQRDSVNTIRQSGETLLTIINDILDFSKIESGRLELEIIPLDLAALVEETVDLFAPVAATRGLDLAYRIDPTLPAWIEGDPTRLRQILANLVNNAVKFTPSGSVSLEIIPASPRSLQFRVRDTGIGIAPDRVDRLFRAFSQVDSSTTRK
ncbi:MAG: PAS domain-containing protein, partial [Burkholderiales bacterium]|nr:PAS domain-containing protein [Opitutaceae bacterium]